MIRWMCCYTKIDRISYGVIKDLVKVTIIKDKMREIKLIWFGNVKRS